MIDLPCFKMSCCTNTVILRLLALLLAGVAPLAGLRAQSNYATPYTFTTFAGAAIVPGSNDGTGSAARFWFPNSVAVDSEGYVYVADGNNSTIRKITPAGVVTTLAGSAGNNGTSDGTGGTAQFNGPSGVAVDGTGNVYVADFYGKTIRKITPGGVVTTLAGSGGMIGSEDGTGSAARFNGPMGVAVDGSGNVYVADLYNCTIRKVTPAGVVTTLAGKASSVGAADGTGSAARFNYPNGLAVDSAGYVYVADTYNDMIRKISPAGVVTTLAGTSTPFGGSSDGTGSVVRFDAPNDVAVDGAGNVYVADSDRSVIRKISPAGEVTTIAGTPGNPLARGSTDGTGSAALFNFPTGIAVDGQGAVYVADQYNNTIRKGVLISTIAPSITVQPVSQILIAGDTVTFTVAASGTPAPTYQWQKNGVAIAGATYSSYTIAGLSSVDAGSYTVVATNSVGSVTSDAGLLTVQAAIVAPSNAIITVTVE